MTNHKIVAVITFSVASMFFFCSCKNDNHDKESGKQLAVISGDTTISEKIRIDSVILINLSAFELTEDYMNNQVKADSEYKGKLVVVHGIVEDVRKGVASNRPFVVLKGHEKFTSVQCYVNDLKTATELKKGTKVVFRGVCEGLNVNVIVNECERLLDYPLEYIQ